MINCLQNLANISGYFLVQSIIVYTAGIKLYMTLELAPPVATTICLLFSLATLIPIAEGFHRAVDYPSKRLAFKMFDWIRE